MYQKYSLTQTRKAGSWWSRHWKKIAVGVATAVGGPLVGAIIGVALSLLPNEKVGIETQFSASVEKHLDIWAKDHLNDYISRKLSVFKNVLSGQDLISANTLRRVNNIFLEMAIVHKYYANRDVIQAIPTVLNAKAIVMQEAIEEVAAIYEGALSEAGLFTPKKIVDKAVIGVIDSPEIINTDIVGLKVKAIHYGVTAIAPGDPSGGITVPTVIISDIPKDDVSVRPQVDTTTYQSPPIISTLPTGIFQTSKPLNDTPENTNNGSGDKGGNALSKIPFWVKLIAAYGVYKVVKK